MKNYALLVIGLLVPAQAWAVSITDFGWKCTGFLFCGSSDTIPARLTTGLVGMIYSSIMAVAVIAFLYGGLRMVISQGAEGKEVGKKALIYASLGIVLASLAFAIIQFVQQAVSSI